MNKFFRKAIVLTLAGSALLYTGCTKDYSGDIQTLSNELSEFKAETNEQIRSLNGQLETVRQTLSSLETAKAQAEANIKTLQNQVAALETFQQTANNKFSALDTEIAGLKANIKSLQDADVALNNAIEAAKARIKALEDNTYTKQEVDGKIQSVEQKIEAAKAWASETFATKATVAAIDEALGQLVGTVDAIITRLDGVDTEIANLKTALGEVKKTAEEALDKANQALSETEDIRQDLVANYYTAATVDGLLNTLKNDLEAQIAAEEAARLAGDAAAQARIDSLANVTKGIEEDLAAYKEATDQKLSDLDGKIDEEIANRMLADLALKGEIADTAAAIRGWVKGIEETLNLKIDANTQSIEALREDLNNKYSELRSDIDALRTDLENLNEYVDYLAYQMNAYAERIQSVVFVPEYDDLCADMISYSIGNEPLKKVVSATFEIQPAEAIVYLDSLINNNAVALAVKEVDSRAIDADEIISDVTVEVTDEARGRFTVEAFLDPDLFDEKVVIACMLGDYDLEGFWAYNAIMSSYVNVKEIERVDLTDGYVWYDEDGDVEMADSLGVTVRIAYTEPATDSLVFNALPEETIAFRMNLNGEFKTLAEVAEYFFVDVLDITPVGEVDSQVTKDALGNEMAENDPFELSDFAPETSLTTTQNADGVVDPQYVHYTTARKEVFRVNGELIAPFAFVESEITKNQVPAFATDTYEIPWSYVHPAALPDGNTQAMGKTFEVDGTTDFGKAIEGAYNDADETFTKDDETYVPGQTEDIAFVPADAQLQLGGLIKFFGWAFEADDVNYVANTERFETESDDYEINVPFVLKKRADDRVVEIGLGELADYHPSTAVTMPIEAVVPAFNGEEAYFIGDAVEFAPGYEVLDSLYSAYANAGSAFHTAPAFAIDSVYVNGEKDDDYIQFLGVNLAWDVVNSEDASVLTIASGKVPYGAEVVVYGRYTEFGVNFDYEISFSTPECPYTLVLTPYDKFDPAKDRTIMVEGDDVIDPDLYTLQQMFYTKYLRVVDQEAYKEGKIQKPAAADIDGADLKVKFTYAYEDLAEFGPNATEADRGEVVGYDEVEVITDSEGDYGYLDLGAVLTWGTYNGLKVTVKAELIENGVSIQTLEDFYIETEKPIELLEAGVIGADEPLIRVSGYNLEVNVAQKMVIGGILSRGENNSKYYVADPAVFGYMDNNICQQDIIDETDPLHPVVVALAGEVCDFYGLAVEYDWDNLTATLNGVEWDLHFGVDYQAYGNVLRLLADNGKGTIVLNVPVRIRYYLDYCGARAVDSGVITINVQQI